MGVCPQFFIGVCQGPTARTLGAVAQRIFAQHFLKSEKEFSINPAYEIYQMGPI
jgi:hypothetical protein